MTPTDRRGSEDLPPSSSIWLSVGKWIRMEIKSKGLRLVLRNAENSRSCEITYKPNLNKWLVKCYILDQITTDLIDTPVWPNGENHKTNHGLPMLNSYDTMIEAMEGFKVWAK